MKKRGGTWSILPDLCANSKEGTDVSAALFSERVTKNCVFVARSLRFTAGMNEVQPQASCRIWKVL